MWLFAVLAATGSAVALGTGMAISGSGPVEVPIEGGKTSKVTLRVASGRAIEGPADLYYADVHVGDFASEDGTPFPGTVVADPPRLTFAARNNVPLTLTIVVPNDVPNGTFTGLLDVFGDDGTGATKEVHLVGAVDQPEPTLLPPAATTVLSGSFGADELGGDLDVGVAGADAMVTARPLSLRVMADGEDPSLSGEAACSDPIPVLDDLADGLPASRLTVSPGIQRIDSGTTKVFDVTADSLGVPGTMIGCIELGYGPATPESQTQPDSVYVTGTVNVPVLLVSTAKPQLQLSGLTALDASEIQCPTIPKSGSTLDLVGDVECLVADVIFGRSERDDKRHFGVSNQGGTQIDLDGGQAIVDDPLLGRATLVASVGASIASGETAPIELTGLSNLNPGHYVGQFRLDLSGTDQSWSVPITIDVKGGILLPFLAILVGIIGTAIYGKLSARAKSLKDSERLLKAVLGALAPLGPEDRDLFAERHAKLIRAADSWGDAEAKAAEGLIVDAGLVEQSRIVERRVPGIPPELSEAWKAVVLALGHVRSLAAVGLTDDARKALNDAITKADAANKANLQPAGFDGGPGDRVSSWPAAKGPRRALWRSPTVIRLAYWTVRFVALVGLVVIGVRLVYTDAIVATGGSLFNAAALVVVGALSEGGSAFSAGLIKGLKK